MTKMLLEILEQPDALDRLLHEESRNITSIAEKIKAHSPAFFELAARGSSDNAATYGKYLFEYANGIPCSLAAPSIHTVYKRRPQLKRGVVIGISQSGEGTDINTVLRNAKKAGAYTIGITNTPDSDITNAAHDVILLRAGLEKGLAATKTYTCQLLALMLISGMLSGDRKFMLHAAHIPEKMRKTLAVRDQIESITERYRYMDRCAIIGRGFNYSTVKEAALKLMETSYVVAQPFSTADFLHGPIAMTGAGFPTFVCIPEGRMAAPLTQLSKDLNDKNLETIIISNRPSALKIASKAINMPVDTDEIFSPIFYIVPFQFFANALSHAKGIDPDKPRFLKKITQTF